MWSLLRQLVQQYTLGAGIFLFNLARFAGRSSDTAGLHTVREDGSRSHSRSDSIVSSACCTVAPSVCIAGAGGSLHSSSGADFSGSGFGAKLEGLECARGVGSDVVGDAWAARGPPLKRQRGLNVKWKMLPQVSQLQERFDA